MVHYKMKITCTGFFSLGALFVFAGLSYGQSSNFDLAIKDAIEQITRRAATAQAVAAPVNAVVSVITVSPKKTSPCGQAPTEATQLSTTQFVLDKSTAAKLGLSFALSGNASYDAKSKVFVREVKRFSSCDSTDGRYSLQYGAAWRATVLIDEAAASGAVNFAVAAASATLHNAAVQVAIEARGWAGSEISQLSATAMQATAAGLNVITFSKFNEAAEQAAAKATTGPLSSTLELIAISPKTADFTPSVITTLALQYLSQGRGCLEVTRDFAVKSPEVESLIRDVYETVA